jgi:2,3-dihydro-2,3-dihydroxybenzoate dehydrogenase
LDFTNKTAVVTGAAQGIGAAVVRALAERGARVAALDTNADGLATLAAELGGEGRHVTPFPADVSDSTAVEETIDRIERELGPIDILVNVAGILRMDSVACITDEDWAATFAVNTTGVFHVSRAVTRRMVPRRSGAVVTVGSNAATAPRMRMAAYAASKAASAQFTKCLGLELAQYGIRCNVVSPGSTDTAMQRQLWTGESGAEAVIRGDLDTHRLGIPLGRLADPSDIADAVVFLASDRARHITMHDLRIDGGATPGA